MLKVLGQLCQNSLKEQLKLRIIDSTNQLKLNFSGCEVPLQIKSMVRHSHWNVTENSLDWC